MNIVLTILHVNQLLRNLNTGARKPDYISECINLNDRDFVLFSYIKKNYTRTNTDIDKTGVRASAMQKVSQSDSS